MTKIKRYLKLTWTLTKFKMSRSMIYSLNFWVAFFVDLLLFIFQLLSFTVIYQFVDDINGWTLAQMFVFVGTFTIVDGLGMGTWFFGIIELPNKIRTGNLDIMLIKPVDTQFYVSASNISPGSLFGVIAGAVIVSYGMVMGSYTLTPGRLAGYILLCLMMYLLMYSLSLLVRTTAFLFVKIDALAMAEDSAVEFAFRIPGTAFKGISKFIFMVLLPYGLIATVPTQFITVLLEPSQWLWVTGITLFFFLASRLFFKFGLNRYTSASS
jgi:ABC-2 type transport system permease protein